MSHPRQAPLPPCLQNEHICTSSVPCAAEQYSAFTQASQAGTGAHEQRLDGRVHCMHG